MKIGRAVLGAGQGMLDRALCVVGAVLFAQAPEFMQQYLQRLGGHLDEARRQLAQFQHVADQSGVTLDRLIAQSTGSSEPTVVRLGGVIQDTVTRVDALTAAQHALQDASVWARPFVFLRTMEFDIARATAAAFKPGVPTTVEGLAYAALGVLVLLAVYHAGIRYPVVRVVRARAAAKASRRSAPRPPSPAAEI